MRYFQVIRIGIFFGQMQRWIDGAWSYLFFCLDVFGQGQVVCVWCFRVNREKKVVVEENVQFKVDIDIEGINDVVKVCWEV